MAKQLMKLMITGLSLLVWPSAQALTLEGVTEFAAIYKLNAATAGVVSSIKVKPGQRVRKEQVLIELDATPHRAKLERALARERSLLPDVEIAQLELERVQQLYDIDSLSQVDLKNAENKLTRAEGAYQAAQADTTLARYQLEQTIIRAPVDGRVLQIKVNDAEFVDPSQSLAPLMILVESRRMKAVGMLNSSQWNPALSDKAATVTYQKQRLKGIVSYVGFNSDGQSSAYEVHVIFDTERLIPAQMPVSIDIKN